MLVVDDEPTVRMLITEVLEDLGYRAIEAADGAAGAEDPAIRCAHRSAGYRCRPARRDERPAAGRRWRACLRPGLKVLFITGYAENAVIGDGHLEPGMQVLTKPFAMENIAGRIKDLIGSR